MAYRICSECGAALDPGERCDCTREQESQANGKTRLTAEYGGQNMSNDEKKNAEIEYIIMLLKKATPAQVHKMFIGATNICHGEDGE